MKRKLTPDASQWLNRNVSNEEIKTVLFQVNPEKAPGLDGYNAVLFSEELGNYWR